MPTPLVDPESIIKKAPPGLMLYFRYVADPSTGWETGLMIREEPRYPAGLAPDPQVRLRAGLINQAGVWLIPLMVRFNADMLYEAWVNVRADGGESTVADLARQESLVIVFYTPQKGRAVQVRNPWRSLFSEQVSPRLADWPHWSMQQFDAAREQVYARWSTPAQLWKAIG